MSYPTIFGDAVEGLLMREAQVCLGPALGLSSYQFFLTGTSTPANVYKDGALTTPFSPTGVVFSDKYGRFPAIYLDSSIIYKVQFYDGTNTLRWTVNAYTVTLSTVGKSALNSFGMTIAPTGEVTIAAPNSGGTNITLSLKAGSLGSSALQISANLPGNSALIINSSAATGAQTATFTASNKPGTATSSPAGWLPITCDGVQLYIPIWHGNNFSPYVVNPTALGEIIVASSFTLTGTGLTTVVGGTANPSNWFAPTAPGIGAGYWINITKTSGLSAVNFSAAQGSWVNIGAGGLTITSNAQFPVSGTYQLSSSSGGTPIVASGTITLSNNNGIQSPTYNGATPLVLAGNGTATLNGSATTNWFLPTTANTGSSYWINIAQTGGTTGTTFTAGVGAWTNITNGGLTIGVTGGTGVTNATGTYIIASDAGGVNQLGSGTVTISGSLVQSPNWSGTTPLKLNGNGSATLNGAGTSDWYSPNSANVGSGYWIDVTNLGTGTSGINFSAAQGSWTNITNSGLTIDLSGTSGKVGTVTCNGTWQISNSSSGAPVLGSGNITLTLSGLTTSRTYTSGSGTETVPAGASFVVIQLIGGGGSGAVGASKFGGAGAGAVSVGGSFGGANSLIPVTGGETFSYSVGAGGAGVSGGTGNAGGNSTVSGTVANGTISLTAGGGPAGSSSQALGGSATATGTSQGINDANTIIGGNSGGSAINFNGGGAAAGGIGTTTGAGVTWVSGLISPDTTGVNAGNGGSSKGGAGTNYGGGSAAADSGTTQAGKPGYIRFFYY